MDKPDIPYIAYERTEAAYERNIKRLWYVILILIAVLFITNLIWICLFFDINLETVDVEADGNSVANYVGEEMDGDINYGGENKSAENNAQERGIEEDNKETCAGE